MAQDGTPPVDTTTLLEAYLAAVYRAQVEGASLPLRVGEPAPALDAAMPAAPGAVATWTLVTAWNPQSCAQDAGVNATADAALHAWVRARDCRPGLRWAAAPTGNGKSTAGWWPAWRRPPPTPWPAATTRPASSTGHGARPCAFACTASVRPATAPAGSTGCTGRVEAAAKPSHHRMRSHRDGA